ncbi:MAG: hypothetical protein P1P78_10010 [Methyloprofundus sp.]|nr:hypothetical protein [Methyloprofundus sp.]
MAVVAFAGSRGLSPTHAPLVRSVVGSVVTSGRSISVGCCIGADQFALSALPVGSGACFAAFGSGGVGSCSLSAVADVLVFAERGGLVNYWAGGGSSVALPVRLSDRTKAVINSATVSSVVFFSSSNSRGSLLACRLAVARGLPVFAFACGFSGSGLPLLGPGAWVAVGGSGLWSSAYRWQCSQKDIF